MNAKQLAVMLDGRQMSHEITVAECEPEYPATEPWRVRLRNRSGADPDEWPEDLRVREWPEVSGE